MDVVINLLELMKNFGVESAVAMALFIAAFTIIFAVYKEKVLKYILHERNVWGVVFSLGICWCGFFPISMWNDFASCILYAADFRCPVSGFEDCNRTQPDYEYVHRELKRVGVTK